MKVNVKDVSGCAKELEVELPAETVQTKVDSIYGRISKEAKMPGFRKGKAPLSELKKQYKSAVREEMVHHELPEIFRTILVDKKIEPVAQPQITHLQFEEGAALKFVATVEIKPDFKLKDYKGLKLKKESTAVTEEEVDKALEGLREQLAQFVPIEDRASKTDDLVVVDFEGKIDGKSFEGGKANHYPVLLGSQGLLKDFEDNLIGVKKGETKTFKVSFPKDYGKPDVAGKTADFTIALHEIKEKKLPVVDNEFAKDMGKAETVKELREKLEAQLKAGKEAAQRSKLVEQIGEILIKDTPFDIPHSLVLMEQQRLVQQGVERLRGQGIDAGKLPDEQKKKLVDDLKPIAQKNVHMALIVERITAAEKIEAQEADLDAYYAKIAQGANQPADVVKRYLQQQGNIEGIKDWIRYEKTLDFLIAQSKITNA
ncbi:MAG TPA: trigger factor [bacterium]|nr:trigger factor [bacterium]